MEPCPSFRPWHDKTSRSADAGKRSTATRSGRCWRGVQALRQRLPPRAVPDRAGRAADHLSPAGVEPGPQERL